MKPLIEPIARELLEQELSDERFLRDTNNVGNKIYTLKAAEAPNVMQEIGRLRELSFRSAGGGTGVEVDIDEDDLDPEGYTQLVVWDPVSKEIVGGYRYIVSRASDTKCLSTEHYFEFSDKFREGYLPYVIELGRSFVQPLYQGTRDNPKGIYALDNLWDGLGALIVKNPSSKYFMGKVTMYEDYNSQARNLLIYFMHKYFEDKDGLLIPKFPTDFNINEQKKKAIFCGANYDEDYRILTKEVRKLGENIPPLINSYMRISPSMKVFGTVVNPDFGGVEETGILITIADLYPNKIERHISNI